MYDGGILYSMYICLSKNLFRNKKAIIIKANVMNPNINVAFIYFLLSFKQNKSLNFPCLENEKYNNGTDKNKPSLVSDV